MNKNRLLKMASLTTLLELITKYKEAKYFPLSCNLIYWVSLAGKELRIRKKKGGDDLQLNFKKHSLQNLRKLASWIDMKYPSSASKPEMIALIEQQMISFSEFEAQIKRAINEENEKWRLEKEKRFQAEQERLEKERIWRELVLKQRQDKLDTFRNELNIDELVRRHDQYLSDKGCEEYDSDVEKELQTSPALYKLLKEKEDTIEELKKENTELNTKLRRIKKLSRKKYSSSDSEYTD